MRLTKKERQVLILMLKGMKPGAIMAKLGIGRSAFTHRRECILTKLGVDNDAQLGMVVIEWGVLTAHERNLIEDYRDETKDARRIHGGQTLEQFIASRQ